MNCLYLLVLLACCGNHQGNCGCGCNHTGRTNNACNANNRCRCNTSCGAMPCTNQTSCTSGVSGGCNTCKCADETPVRPVCPCENVRQEPMPRLDPIPRPYPGFPEPKSCGCDD